MIVGIVGLGLIGGSLAKAYKENGNHTVYAMDTDAAILEVAKLAGVVDETLQQENIGACDILLIALYPKAAIAYLREHASHIASHTVVVDCCGTKREVCKECFPIAREYGFVFAGGHPMAGKQQSGYKYSSATLFKEASMILVPDTDGDVKVSDMPQISHIKQLLAPVGFGRITLSTADKHDEMIAFTSQMAHVVSNAFIKSPTAKAHKGFSAGSYKDLTRVAYLNEEMWTELFMENSDNLVKELDYFMGEIARYREAIVNADECALRALLREGKDCKKEVDG